MTTGTLLAPPRSQLDIPPGVGYALPDVRRAGSVSDGNGAAVAVTAFGALVKELRLSKGLTQREVAEVGELATGYVGGVETGTRGQRPARKFVLKFAAGLRATRAERDQLLLAAGYPVGALKGPTFEQVVAQDPKLRPDQRVALLSTYRTMTER